jgi:predicted aldo/keto reductase-like oxidoreductase
VQISLLMNLPSFMRRFPAERFAAGWLAQGLESAGRCIECGACEDQCPYHLPIREMIREHIDHYEQVMQGTPA